MFYSFLGAFLGLIFTGIIFFFVFFQLNKDDY